MCESHDALISGQPRVDAKRGRTTDYFDEVWPCQRSPPLG